MKQDGLGRGRECFCFYLVSNEFHPTLFARRPPLLLAASIDPSVMRPSVWIDQAIDSGSIIRGVKRESTVPGSY